MTAEKKIFLIYFEEFVKIATEELHSTDEHEKQIHEILENYEENVGKLEQSIAALKEQLMKEKVKFHQKFDEKLQNVGRFEMEIAKLEEYFIKKIEHEM